MSALIQLFGANFAVAKRRQHKSSTECDGAGSVNLAVRRNVAVLFYCRLTVVKTVIECFQNKAKTNLERNCASVFTELTKVLRPKFDLIEQTQTDFGRRLCLPMQ